MSLFFRQWQQLDRPRQNVHACAAPCRAGRAAKPDPRSFSRIRALCTLAHSLRGLDKLVNLMELYCGNNDIAAASEVHISKKRDLTKNMGAEGMVVRPRSFDLLYASAPSEVGAHSAKLNKDLNKNVGVYKHDFFLRREPRGYVGATRCVHEDGLSLKRKTTHLPGPHPRAAPRCSLRWGVSSPCHGS